MNVEFTDRYGGHVPSWLRGCHGPCEALGWHPSRDSREADGWAFVPCQACQGTGRVNWLVTVSRVPRWVWKGLRFIPFAMRPDVSPPEWSAWKRFTVAIWAAWGADLEALWR